MRFVHISDIHLGKLLYQQNRRFSHGWRYL